MPFILLVQCFVHTPHRTIRHDSEYEVTVAQQATDPLVVRIARPRRLADSGQLLTVRLTEACFLGKEAATDPARFHGESSDGQRGATAARSTPALDPQRARESRV